MYGAGHLQCVRYTYDDHDQRTHECGSSALEARTRGCVWDPVGFAWLPERCSDRELATELLTKTNWTLYADPKGTIKKSNEDFADDNSNTYLTTADHVLHCVFAWKRIHRALLAGNPYHSGLSLDHTNHCAHIILQSLGQDPTRIETRALVIYPAC